MSTERDSNEVADCVSALNVELDDHLPPEPGDAERFAWLIENWLTYKPAGYDGCDKGRFDLYAFSETGDIRKAIDKRLLR
jgi:hypothetical protein